MAPILRSTIPFSHSSPSSLSLFRQLFLLPRFINRFISWRDRPPRDKETRSSVHEFVRNEDNGYICYIYISGWRIAANCATQRAYSSQLAVRVRILRVSGALRGNAQSQINDTSFCASKCSSSGVSREPGACHQRTSRAHADIARYEGKSANPLLGKFTFPTAIYVKCNDPFEYSCEGKSAKPLLGKFTFPPIVIYVKCKDYLRGKIIQAFKAIAWKIYVSINRYIRKIQGSFCTHIRILLVAKENHLKPPTLLGKFTFSPIIIYVKCKNSFAWILLRREIIQLFKAIAWKIYIFTNRYIRKM